MIGTRIGQGFAIGGLGLLVGGPSGDAFPSAMPACMWRKLTRSP